MFKHLPVAHFHDATFLKKHIEVYRHAVVTVQIGVFVRAMTVFSETVNLEHLASIELAITAWKAVVIPLHHRCEF